MFFILTERLKHGQNSPQINYFVTLKAQNFREFVKRRIEVKRLVTHKGNVNTFSAKTAQATAAIKLMIDQTVFREPCINK